MSPPTRIGGERGEWYDYLLCAADGVTKMQSAPSSRRRRKILIGRMVKGKQLFITRYGMKELGDIRVRLVSSHPFI
jgi:hypothetical protein